MCWELPQRPTGETKKKLSDYFDSIAYEYEFKDAIKDKYLCPIKTLTVPLELDITKVKMQSGDFAAKDIGDTLDSYLEEIAERIKEHCQERKTVVFLPLVSTSQQFCRILNKKGISAAEVHGGSVNREEVLEGFKSGKYKVICNAMLLTEGWDCPEVDCIVVLRPTRSDSLYRQMVGRGCRTAEGKKDLLLLDFLWLSKRVDLMKPASLIGKTQDILDRMNKISKKSSKALDLFALEEKATRDYENEIKQKLAEELRRQNIEAIQNKIMYDAGTILLERGLLFYEPIFEWEYSRITPAQKETLNKMGIRDKNIELLTKGHAHVLINVLTKRSNLGLSSYKQIAFLKSKGFKDVQQWSFKEASTLISQIVDNRWEIPSGIIPSEYIP